MAEFKHIHGKTTTWDQRPWGNLEDLVKSMFSTGDDTKEELKCTCGPGLSSRHQLLISHKPTKSIRKKRHAPSRTKSTKNQKTFSKLSVENSSGSSPASNYSTLCDRPRLVDKTYKKVSKVKYPDVTRVKSIEITERFKKNCCSGVKRENVLKSKISTTNLLLSPSSAGYCESNSSVETEVKFRNKSKGKSKTKTKFKVDCEKTETKKDNSVKHLYRNKNKFEVQKSCEKISDCQDRDGDFLLDKTHFESKSRESFYSRSSSGKSRDKRKVFRDDNFRFKNNCPGQADDCCCFWNCSDECAFECCQEKNCDEKNRCNNAKFRYNDQNFEYNAQNLKHNQKFKHNDQKFKYNDKNLKHNNKKYAYNDQNLKIKDSPESLCDCISEGDIKKSKLPSNWNKCEKYLKNISKEYRSLSSHLQDMQEKIKKSPGIKLSYKLKSSKRYLNTENPCENEIEYNINKNKISDDEDTIKALTSLCETFKTMSREIDPVENNEQELCKTEYCNCHIGAEEGIKRELGATTEPGRLKKRRKKKGVRLHEFAFPKIVKSEKSDGRGNVKKMFVYAPEGNDQSNSAPLTLYRTCSFVNCNIKSNNDDGYKYHLTYVQKYVSPTWKSNQSGDQNYLDYSSSDYG